MQHNIIQEIMRYEFELGHNTMGATKNIYCAKDERIQ